MLKKNIVKKTLLVCICAFMTFNFVGEDIAQVSHSTVNAASKTSNITVSKYIKLLTTASKAKKKDLVEDGEFANTKATISIEDAAVLADRADEYINGKKCSKSLYDNIVKYKRISDIKKADKAKREALYRCFTKGIMIGSSNGKYSQSRKFNPKGKLKVEDANTIASRLKDTRKRIKLSYDGQVVRTVNLPKNYKQYPYILASFPNSFYEPSMDYQRVTYGHNKEYEDYCKPKNLDKMYYAGEYVGKALKESRDVVLDNLHTNLMTRLNFNYKTTNTNEWISTLASTYVSQDYIVDDMKDYVKKAKKNKVVVQCKKVILEPSAAYFFNNNIIVRAHIRIKVTATKWYNYKTDKQRELVYATRDTGFYGLKKNKWYDMECDVKLSGNYMDKVKDCKVNWYSDVLCEAGW